MADSPHAQQLHVLQHSLGLDRFGRGQRYRNHFVAGRGGHDYDTCCSLVAEGLMRNAGASELTGGDACFVVTQAGIDFVTSKSPAPPKETRGQKRYRAYLEAETGESFSEWIAAHG